jgi:hypothetical protein
LQFGSWEDLGKEKEMNLSASHWILGQGRRVCVYCCFVVLIDDGFFGVWEQFVVRCLLIFPRIEIIFLIFFMSRLSKSKRGLSEWPSPVWKGKREESGLLLTLVCLHSMMLDT